MSLTERSWFAGAAVGLLAVLCGVLAFEQHMWLGEVSTAELQQLHQELNNRVDLFSTSFEDRISRALMAVESSMESSNDGSPFAGRALERQKSGDPIFSRIARVKFQGDALSYSELDFNTGEFHPAAWPQAWASKQEELLARTQRREGRPGPGGPGSNGPANQTAQPELIEIFNPGPPRGPGPNERPSRGGPPRQGSDNGPQILLAELNQNYLRSTLIPELMAKYVQGAGQQWEAAVVAPDGKVIYETVPGAGKAIAAAPVAQATLLAGFGRGGPFGGNGRFGPGRFGGARFGGGRPPQDGPAGEERPARFNNPAAQHWTVVARNRAGSLEAIVERVRRRNLAVSAGMLLLIMGMVSLLVMLSRQRDRLAALQMNFVAGVSHELRTPLTVIRTAAFNLRGKLSHRPDQVERYGKLIQDESEKLTGLVEQVLLFARAKSVAAARDRKPVPVDELIESSLRASLGPAEASAGFIEMDIAPGLPPVAIDQPAVTQALRNLIDNAMKYAVESDTRQPWLGISARHGKPSGVEIRVADHGPGIPAEEQAHIFEAFFRGRSALDAQIHGTGLGLNLARSIIDANGGSIRVSSQLAQGTEFIVSLPAAGATA